MLSHSIPFSRDAAAEFFHQFPAAPAVFLLRGADRSAEPYVSKTANLRRRLKRLLAPPESQSKRLNLRDRVAKIEYTLTGSDFESVFLLYKALRREFPKNYQKRLRLRPAPLVRLNLENEYPRAYVTTKIGRLGSKSLYYGPFRSRATAEKFLNDSLDQFKMRRCTFDLNPDPKFPGCVYSEMKMCLAPCFKGCSDEQYVAEVGRVQAYFDSGGQSLIHEMEAERERLSGTLDFENAAHQHSRIAKMKSLLFAWDELCGPLDRLDAVIIQPSAVREPKSVALFRFRQGELGGPYHLAVDTEGEGGGQPMERRVRAAIDEFVPAGACSATQFTEELAIVKRWHYRSHKVGELVVSKLDGSWPLRRLANAAIRVGRGEKQPDVPVETPS